MDQQESIDNPAMEWFWPLRKTEDTAEEAASSSDSEESQPENDEIIYKVIHSRKKSLILNNFRIIYYKHCIVSLPISWIC